MDSVANKYNRFLITLIAIAPFLAYFTLTYLNMDFRRLMQFLSFIGVFLVLIFKPIDKSVKIPSYLIYYLLFIIYVFYSDLIRLNRDFKIDYLFSNRLIGGFNFMLIIENLFITKKHYKFIINISKKVLIIAFFVIVYQQVVNNNFFMRPGIVNEDMVSNDNVGRLYSIYSWIGWIVSCGLSFVPIFIIVLEEVSKKKKNIQIWLLMGIIFAFLTKQRWLMINFSLVIFLFFINYEHKQIRFIKLSLFLPIIFVVSFSLLDFVGIDATGIVKERILETDKKKLGQKSASTRLLAFSAFNKFYWDNPITGVGNIKYGMGAPLNNKQEFKLRQFLKGRSSQIHVGYLSLFYLYGLIGGIFFMSFLFNLFRKLFRNANKTTYWGPFLGILGFAIDNWLDVNFQLFEMGLIIALFADKYYSDVYNSMKKIHA